MATDEAFCSLRVDEGINAHTATEEEPDEPDPLHVLAAKRLVALATDETERPPLAQRLRGRTAPAGELVERQAIRVIRHVCAVGAGLPRMAPADRLHP
jgi:hypothetical protein